MKVAVDATLLRAAAELLRGCGDDQVSALEGQLIVFPSDVAERLEAALQLAEGVAMVSGGQEQEGLHEALRALERIEEVVTTALAAVRTEINEAAPRRDGEVRG